MSQSTKGDTGRGARASAPERSAVDYERAFGVLERCDRASCLSDFKAQVVEAIGSVIGFGDVSFFAGPTFGSAFNDPHPITSGKTALMLPEYHERWWRHDVFGTPQASRMFQLSGATSTGELNRFPASRTATDAYTQHFLWGTWGLRSAAAIQVDLYGRHTGLIGIFAADEQMLGPREMATLRAMGRQLSAVARGIPFAPPRHDCSALTPRQREVAHLLAEGFSNARIAQTLSVAEESVKKYVTRILAVTQCQTRMELALMIRQGPCSMNADAPARPVRTTGPMGAALIGAQKPE